MRSLLMPTLGLALAVAGPAVVAFASSYAANAEHAILVHVVSLASIMLIVLFVFALATHVEGIALRQIGFGRVSWSSVAIGPALAFFFVTAFGPLAYWMVAKLKMGRQNRAADDILV
jgi:hypothetical protein